MAIKPKNVDLTASSVEILNQIREGSSAAYQKAIPKAAGNTERRNHDGLRTVTERVFKRPV